MHLDRKGTQIIIDLDKEEDAVGLFAVLSNQHQIDPAVLAHGQEIYKWFYSSVAKLAANYGAEQSVVTQSAETIRYAKPTFKPRRTKR